MMRLNTLMGIRPKSSNPLDCILYQIVVTVLAVISTYVVLVVRRHPGSGCKNCAITYLAHTQRSERPQISCDMSDFHLSLVFKSVATSGKIDCQHGKE